MLVALRPVLDFARENGFGVPALNVNNLEQILAIMDAAKRVDSPVIFQMSRGARKYAKDRFLRALMQAAVEEYPEIPIVMHLDHGNSPETCESAIKAGFTSVMMTAACRRTASLPPTSNTTWPSLLRLWRWRSRRRFPWRANLAVSAI